MVEMNIKIKAIIYKYTGIYLAKKERDNYIYTNEFWESFGELYNMHEDMSTETTYGLIIGMWKSNNGFTRPISFIRFKDPRWLFIPIAWFTTLFKVIKWDIQGIYHKLRKENE